MSHQKLKIQFHPRKISSSNSKQKYSPYRRREKRGEKDEVLQENRQKLDLNEPIIRFRRHIQSSSIKNRLKITHDGQKCSPNPHPSSPPQDQETGSTFHETCFNCTLLLRKIEEQTLFLKQNMKEINNNLKFPKLSKDENEKKNEQEDYAQNQKIIIGYLEQIKNRGEELTHLKHARNSLEQEVLTLRKALREQQAKNKSLETELEFIKQELANHQYICNLKQTQDAATSSLSIQAQQDSPPHRIEDSQKTNAISYKEEVKSIMSDIMERHSFDFQNIMKELQTIKLQNDMLRQQVKLLNYSMHEKDAKIDALKSELINFIQKTKRSYHPSPSKSAKSSIKQSGKKSIKRVELKSSEVSIECIDNSYNNKDLSITNKRTSSFLLSSKSNLLIDKFKQDLSEGDCKSEKGDNQYLDLKKGRTMPFNLSLQLTKEIAKMHEQDKLTRAKPFLRLKKQESIITKHQKQQLERQKKELFYFSQNKLRELDLIQRTLQHRFKGFKFTFQQLQAQMLGREDYCIAYDQIDKLLAEYPFMLERRLRKIALEYVLRETGKNEQGKRSLSSDLFCNRLRELLTDYDEVEEEEELILVEKLKKKVYMYLQGIQNQCVQAEDRRGLVSQENMQRILEQFKFSKLEIEMFIDQCCLLSTDADHLDYKQYLSIFQNDQ